MIANRFNRPPITFAWLDIDGDADKAISAICNQPWVNQLKFEIPGTVH